MTKNYLYRVDSITPAFNFFNKYKNYICKMAKKKALVIKGITEEDVIQNAFIGLVEAAKYFKAGHNETPHFFTYMKLYVDKMITKDRTSIKISHKLANARKVPIKTVSLPEGIEDDRTDVWVDNNALTPEEMSNYNLTMEKVRKVINKLDDEDRDIICSYYGIGVERQTSVEISKRYGCTYQNINIKIKRIQRTLYKLFMRYNPNVGELLDYEI